LGGSRMGRYDVAQVCANGHVVNANTEELPEHNRTFCSECGERTIVECPVCKNSIAGQYMPASGLKGTYRRPAFCSSCGKPYPWTLRRLAAARELALEMEGLTDDERKSLAGTLDDLSADTPRTQLAATRFKPLLAKPGKAPATALRDIMVDVMSEAAKKAVFGP
jgi:hypothetical protein